MERKPDAGQPALPVIAVINFFSFLDTNLLIPVMALYAAALGAAPAIIGLLVGLYSIFNTPANIVSGRLIDRFGYKLPMVIGLVGSSVNMFAYTLTRLPVHLALVRSIHGITGGLKSPAIMSAFTERAGEKQRGRVMGFYGMSLAIANLVGFGLSGVIVSRSGYPPLFFLGMGVLAAGAVTALFLPGGRRPAGSPPHLSTKQHLAMMKELLKRRNLQVAYLTIFAQYSTFGGVVTLMPLHIKSLGMDAFHSGMSLAAFTVAFILLQFPAGLLSDKLGRRKLINAGLTLATLSLLALPWLTSFPALVAVMAVYGMAFGLLFPSASALVADTAAENERGTASGIFHALLTAGVGVGAPVLGGIGGLMGIRAGMVFIPAILAVTLVFLSVVRNEAAE